MSPPSIDFAQGNDWRTNNGLVSPLPKELRPDALGSRCLSLERDAQQRCHDSDTGDKCPAYRTGNLGNAAGAATMVHRHLENTETTTRDFHLHFQIPSVGRFAHY